jgi:hypothetical protein
MCFVLLICCTSPLQVIEEHKQLLKQKYGQAKSLAADVNHGKGRITDLKAIMERQRVRRAMLQVEGGASGDEVGQQLQVMDAEEERCKSEIEQVGGSKMPQSCLGMRILFCLVACLAGPCSFGIE